MRRRQSLLAATVLTLACFGVYGKTLGYSFVYWDDQNQVLQNPMVNPPSTANLAELWKKPYFGLYIPLTYTAWSGAAWVSRAIDGNPAGHPLHPGVFHGLNLLLHLLCTLTVFLLLRHLLRGKAEGALAGSLLFALHPLQVEPVAWISGSRDLLAAWLGLLALWQYLVYSDQAGQDRSGSGAGTYAVATLAFALSLAAKPSLITLPAIAVAVNHFVLGKRGRECARGLLTWVWLALPFAYLTKVQQPDHALMAATPIWQRPLVALDAGFFYLRKLVWPDWLVTDYGRTPGLVAENPWSWVYAGLALLALGGVWRVRKRAPELTLGLVWIVLGLLPVCGLIAFNFQDYSTVADRYMYLPMAGVALAFALFCERLRLRLSAGEPARASAAAGAAGTLLFALAIRAFIQVSVWEDDRSLFTHTLEYNPASFMAETSLGLMHFDSGRPDEAIAHFRKAVALNPRYVTARTNLGSSLLQKKDYAGEAEQLEAISLQHPENPAYHVNLGVALSNVGKFAAALRHFETARRLDPGINGVRSDIGMMLLELGRAPEAVTELRQALAGEPGNRFLRANLEAAEQKLKESGMLKTPQKNPEPR